MVEKGYPSLGLLGLPEASLQGASLVRRNVGSMRKPYTSAAHPQEWPHQGHPALVGHEAPQWACSPVSHCPPSLGGLGDNVSQSRQAVASWQGWETLLTPALPSQGWLGVEYGSGILGGQNPHFREKPPQYPKKATCRTVHRNINQCPGLPDGRDRKSVV